MPTTSDYLSQLQQDREDLVDNLETQGISDLTGNETFTELVPKVLDIETGGGDTPEKGVIFSEWDNDGYPTKVEFVGMTTIPKDYLYNSYYNATITSKISNVKLNNVEEIGQSAFSYNKGLTDLPQSNLLKTIGANAFGGSKIINCNIPSNVTSLGTDCFNGCNLLQSVTLSDYITSIPNFCFQSCSSLTSLDLKNVRTIGTSAFYNCTNLETIVFSNNLTSISSQGFRNCTKLNFTKIPENVTLAQQAFSSCNSLKKLSVLNIGNFNANASNGSAFWGCTGLKRVWLGSYTTNTKMGRYAFQNCNNLEYIYIDLPRATVEAFTNYQYAFMNNTAKTGIIVCNDDPNFIDKETFDALDVDTL